MKSIKANFVTKYSLIDTFRQMKPGVLVEFSERDFKYASGRAAKYMLRKEGIEMALSQKGMVGKWTAMRIK